MLQLYFNTVTCLAILKFKPNVASSRDCIMSLKIFHAFLKAPAPGITGIQEKLSFHFKRKESFSPCDIRRQIQNSNIITGFKIMQIFKNLMIFEYLGLAKL